MSMTPKIGQIREVAGVTEKWNGKRWVPIRVARVSDPMKVGPIDAQDDRGPIEDEN